MTLKERLAGPLALLKELTEASKADSHISDALIGYAFRSHVLSYRRILNEIEYPSPEVGAPITQCLTAGAVSSTTEGTRLVCAKCGQQHLMAMGLFDYDLNQYADYPTEHPDRCLKLDGKFYDPPIMEQGKSRPHWRCHKKAGHDSTNGGMHCSTHRDCGARIGDPGDRGICGNEPLHDNGIHEAHSSPQKACIECKLGDGQHAAHCSNREPHDPIRR